MTVSAPPGLLMRWTLLLAGSVACGAPSAANLAECERLPMPAVSVQLMENKVGFNTEFGYRSLTSIGGDKVRPGSQVLGLTRANAVARFNLNMPAYRDAGQRYECASPQITLTLGFNQITVYVGKEFPKGSCAYKEILAHEMRHVKAYQAHLASVQKEVQGGISNRFATGSVWRGAVGASYARVLQELDERWLPYVNREIGKVEEPQALIDTPEEYERLQNACNGEVRKVLQ
jgi:hypothetical protein